MGCLLFRWFKLSAMKPTQEGNLKYTTRIKENLGCKLNELEFEWSQLTYPPL